MHKLHKTQTRREQGDYRIWLVNGAAEVLMGTEVSRCQDLQLR